jgi:uncharacterized protein DUF5060/uncharacterized protein DUF4038
MFFRIALLVGNLVPIVTLFTAVGCGSGSSGSSGAPGPAEAPAEAPAVVFPRWSVIEVELVAAGKYRNPFTDVQVTATLRGPGGLVKTVPGFWAGKNEFRVRFTPTEEGEWSYEVKSSPADHGLAVRGDFIAVRPDGDEHGFLRRDPAHPRSFVHDDGTHVFLWGQTYYEIIRNARMGSDWKRAIEGTRSHGMNKVRLLVNPSWDTDTDIYPKSSPFSATTRDSITLPHWEALDEVVEHLARKGMIADLILFLDHKDGFGTRTQDLRYVRYVLARYAAYPNVIWCLTNEWHYTGKDRSYWNEVGDLVRREDPWIEDGEAFRPLSIHHKTGYRFEFGHAGWPIHAVIQVGVRNAKFQEGDRWGNDGILINSGLGMPVVNDEYGYLGERDASARTGVDADTPIDETRPGGENLQTAPLLSREKHRNIIWGIATAGGYGSAGDHREYSDGTPIFSANWHDDPGYADIARLIDFWTRRGIQYWRMSSRNDLVVSGDRVYVLALVGKEYVIYSAQGGDFTLQLAAGRYSATRFDPKTGATAPFLDISGGGPRAFLLPDGEDWIVHVKKTGI